MPGRPARDVGALERGVESLVDFAALGDLGQRDAATLAHFFQLRAVREPGERGGGFARRAIGYRGQARDAPVAVRFRLR